LIDMLFYDLHVHTKESIGENSLEEIVAMAKKLDLRGMAIARYHDNITELPTIEGIDLINAVIVKAETPEELNRIVKEVRNSAEIVMVHGGNYDINRTACENHMVDILCHPELGRKDSGLDHICVRAAKDNNVAIEINFREVLESFKRHRLYVLSSMKNNIMLCKKYEVDVVTTSAAVSKWELRGGRELASMSYLLGLDLASAIASVTTIPENIVKTNREKLKGNLWEGVKLE